MLLYHQLHQSLSLVNHPLLFSPFLPSFPLPYSNHSSLFLVILLSSACLLMSPSTSLPVTSFSPSSFILLQCITGKHINISSPLPSNTLGSMLFFLTFYCHLYHPFLYSVFNNITLFHTFPAYFTYKFPTSLLKGYFFFCDCDHRHLMGPLFSPFLLSPLLCDKLYCSVSRVDALDVTVREMGKNSAVASQ